MPFCTQCGQQVYDGAKFCPECGTSLILVPPQTQRRKVFEGDIRECPSCGTPLKAFDLVCPVCGHEIRNREVSTAVQKFAKEIARLEAERDSLSMPMAEGTENSKSAKTARRKARELTDRKIASHIQNFPIPNTKEDLFEFLILSSSNISEDHYSDRISKGQKTISDAWKSKFEQAYHKAKISFGNMPEFEKIDTIYKTKQKSEEQKKKEEERNKKRKNRLKLLDDSFLFIPWSILLLILLLILPWSIVSNDKKTTEENARLESIVEEIYTCIENEDYNLARAKTATLVFSGYSEEDTEKWEKTRREMYATIDRAEGIEPGTIPDIQDVAGTSPEEENKGLFSNAVEGLRSFLGF